VPYCGFSCDRDYNASRNILIAGMEQPVAPIESKPPHYISVMPGFGDEVGSRAIQDAVVHVVNLYAIELACMESGMVALLNLFDTGFMLMGFFMAIALLTGFVILV